MEGFRVEDRRRILARCPPQAPLPTLDRRRFQWRWALGRMTFFCLTISRATGGPSQPKISSNRKSRGPKCSVICLRAEQSSKPFQSSKSVMDWLIGLLPSLRQFHL